MMRASHIRKKYVYREPRDAEYVSGDEATKEKLKLTSRSFDRVRASTEMPMSLVTVIPETTCGEERALAISFALKDPSHLDSPKSRHPPTPATPFHLDPSLPQDDHTAIHLPTRP